MRRAVNYVLVCFVFVFLAVGCQSTTGKTAGETMSDAGITTSVKAKLAGDRMGTLTQVDVETVRNTVYLTGVVPTIEDKRKAEELARNVNGVQQVVNNLQVRAAKP